MPDLELALRELGTELDVPPEPPLSRLVAERLRREGAPARPGSRRRLLALALAVLAVAVAAAMAVPSVRSAVLDFFRIGSAEVERVPTLPPPGTDDLDLGRLVTLDEARDAVPFELAEPSVDVAAIYLDESLPGGRVSFVLAGRRGVLMEFAGESVSLAQKSAGPGTRLSPVTVEGREGVWISGRPHIVVFRDRDGQFHDERTRLAGNVLLWEGARATFRLEGARTLGEALEIARGVH
jgi:hypothetical protein